MRNGGPGFGNLMLLVIICAWQMGCTARPPAGRPADPIPPIAGQLPAVGAGAILDAFPVMPGGFRRVRGASVQGHTQEKLDGVSLVECALACRVSKDFACRSFDYDSRVRICQLSEHTAEEIGGLENVADDLPTLEHYERHPGNPTD
ncbi:MAG: hypothetical protein GY725_11420 [bacterium]|nr:hypothetical protein [bacterium]